MNVIIYASIKPTIPPAILEKKPSIIVAFNIPSIKPLIFNNILSIKYNIENTTKNAITSYSKIFNTDTPLIIPPKLKNGNVYKGM